MGNCCVKPTMTLVESKILLIGSDIKLLEYLESKLILNVQVLENVDNAINYMKKIKFEETKVIIIDTLFSEFITAFKENLLDMSFAPKIIILSNDKNKFIESNKNYQDKNNEFYKYGGVANNFEDIKEFIEKNDEQILEEVSASKQINNTNEIQLTFEYIDCKEKLMLPLFFKALIDKKVNDYTKIYNDELYYHYSDEKNELKLLLSSIKSLYNIPIEILSKYYAKLYTANSTFHRNINRDLGLNKTGNYLLFIRTLYEGVKLKSLPLANNNILYRGSLISNEEVKKIKVYLSKKLENLPGSIVFSRAFLSFSKIKSVAESFLSFQNNNTNLSKVLYILEKDDDIGFNLSTHGDIENISYFPNEKEVLFFPFSSFEIQDIKEIIINNDILYEIKLLYLGKYLKDIDNDNKIVIDGKKIPESEFKKQLCEFGLIEKERIQNLNTKILFNIYKKYEGEIQNIIIAEFYIRPKDINNDVQIINSYENAEPPDIGLEGDIPPNNEREIIENIEIRINGEKIEFSYMHKFEKEGKYKIEYLFKKNITRTTYMFSNCNRLIDINLSNFNSQNVIDTNNMFSYSSSLKCINLTNFNTSKVTDMKYMFSGCDSLTSLNLLNFDTKNVINMSYMFSYCESLTDLDLSSFNTQKVKNLGGMFLDCRNLKNLNLSKFDTRNVSYMNEIFSGCESLKKENIITNDIKILNEFK
jgi:surface protein